MCAVLSDLPVSFGAGLPCMYLVDLICLCQILHNKINVLITFPFQVISKWVISFYNRNESYNQTTCIWNNGSPMNSGIFTHFSCLNFQIHSNDWYFAWWRNVDFFNWLRKPLICRDIMYIRCQICLLHRWYLHRHKSLSAGLGGANVVIGVQAWGQEPEGWA